MAGYGKAPQLAVHGPPVSAKKAASAGQDCTAQVLQADSCAQRVRCIHVSEDVTSRPQRLIRLTYGVPT
jgi:hypothetical protein